MKADEIAKLEALLEKATPGEWVADVSVSNAGGWKQPTQNIEIVADTTLVARYDTDYCEYPSDEQNAANAALIAAMKNALPELLKAARDGERYRFLTRLWPLEITLLVQGFHAGPTTSEVHGAIDAAMKEASRG